MTEHAPRPIGSEFEVITETPTERVVTTWRVIGHALTDDGAVERVERVIETRQTKAPPLPSERKSS